MVPSIDNQELGTNWGNEIKKFHVELYKLGIKSEKLCVNPRIPWVKSSDDNICWSYSNIYSTTVFIPCILPTKAHINSHE